VFSTELEDIGGLPEQENISHDFLGDVLEVECEHNETQQHAKQQEEKHLRVNEKSEEEAISK